MIMIIFMQDIIFMLKFNIKMLDINVYVNIMKANNFFKKYSLKIILHILIQQFNNLITVIIIYKTHNSLNHAVYTIIIIYFKKLIKHFNVEETINIIKIALFNSCFNE